MDDKDRIQDIPSFKKFHQQLNDLKEAESALSIIGIDKSKQKDISDRIREAEQKESRITTISDRFNEIFANRGWIMYEMMNCKVAEAAIKKAESNDIDGAETDLTNYYTEEIIGFNIRRMKDIKAFRPRWQLAQNALKDYIDGRYYASVHVVQALLDGMVNEIYLRAYGYHRGFYANDADLTAWDSISAHSKGLMLLAKTLSRGRNVTRTEEIFIPYRHGIVHSTDLSYDNKMVAAKIWAALFSTRNWALKAEKDELTIQQASEKPITWNDVARQLMKNTEMEARLSNWKPRAISLGKEIPITGSPESFADETPEKKLAEYLAHWANDRFDKMTEYVPLKSNNNSKISPREMRIAYNQEQLHSWEFESIKDTAEGRSEIKAKLKLKGFGRIAREPTEHVFFMIDYGGSGESKVGEKSIRDWRVFNWNWINFK